MRRIVFAYSGDSAAAGAIAWLRARYTADVVTLTLDVGQGRELEPVRDRALALGAVRAHVLDVHDAFVRDYLLPALAAGALFDGDRSLVPALTRPLLAERLAEVAAIEQTSYIAHACAADDLRVSVAARALDPTLHVIAVPRETPAALPVRHSAPTAAEPALVDIAFERGVPVAINGIVMPLADLIRSLEIIARAHGIDETLRVLNAALSHLQRAMRSDESAEIRGRYLALLDRGDWFTPVRGELDRTVAEGQAFVCGTVHLKLFRGASELSHVERPPASRRLTVLA